jgi:hypothetical protein
LVPRAKCDSGSRHDAGYDRLFDSLLPQTHQMLEELAAHVTWRAERQRLYWQRAELYLRLAPVTRRPGSITLPAGGVLTYSFDSLGRRQQMTTLTDK